MNMKTQIVPVTDESLSLAGKIIREGGLVGFPTETVYGLGANALDAEAVSRIFEAKGRPGDNPLIVHIHEMSQIEGLIDGALPDNARRLAQAYWPGPLTMILPRSKNVPDAVTAGLATVGIRMPSHPGARAFLQAAGVPVAAPSANRSGRPSPTTAAHVFADMDGRVPLILDGGPCEVGLESTVLDVLSDPPRVLRPGGVTPEMVAKVLGACDVDGSVLRPLQKGEIARSPGMKYRHYAPKGSLLIVRGVNAKAEIIRRYDQAESQGQKACILASDPAPYGNRRVRVLGEGAADFAAELFAALREMDDLGAEAIFSEAVEATGLGLAVMNRMGRAAAFQEIDAGDTP